MPQRLLRFAAMHRANCLKMTPEQAFLPLWSLLPPPFATVRECGEGTIRVASQ
jgi:hypothetical protein